jgi:ABC-type iron transport system FetAB permease component
MASAIRFVLANFTLTFLAVGLIASAAALIRSPKPLTTSVVVEALFAYFLLFSIGFSLFYNFVLHTFFGEMVQVLLVGRTARFRRRSASPAWDTRLWVSWLSGAASIFGLPQ